MRSSLPGPAVPLALWRLFWRIPWLAVGYIVSGSAFAVEVCQILGDDASRVHRPDLLEDRQRLLGIAAVAHSGGEERVRAFVPLGGGTGWQQEPGRTRTPADTWDLTDLCRSAGA